MRNSRRLTRETKYNNLNFVLLERIATKVDGRPMQTQLAERVFQPLGMRDSIFPTDTALAGGTRGYSLDETTLQFADKTVLNPTVAGGAGAMISSLRDLRPSVRIRHGRVRCFMAGPVHACRNPGVRWPVDRRIADTPTARAENSQGVGRVRRTQWRERSLCTPEQPIAARNSKDCSGVDIAQSWRELE